MSAKIKMRSVSVEDLGNIVKHMTSDVNLMYLADQVAKLYQAAFEEYYFKNMEELKQVKSNIDADELDQEAKGSSTGSDQVPPIRGTSDPNFFNDRNLDQKLNSQDQKSYSDVPKEGVLSGDQNDSRIIITKSSQSNAVLNSQKGDEEAATNSLHKEISDSNFHGQQSTDVLDAPVVRVVRRPKHTRLPQESNMQTANSCSSNIALNSTNNYTTTNLTRTRDNVVTSKVKIREKVESEKNVLSNNTDVIEWWSTSLKKEIPEQRDDGRLEKPREILVQFKNKGELAFENWKKEKTKTYRRIFKEEQKRLRLEQAAKAKQLAKKEAANEAYLHWRRQQDAQQKLITNTKKLISAQLQSQKLQSREKRAANSQAFKIWKRQKDAKLRERKMYMMSYDQYCHPQHKPKLQKPRPGIHVAFNMWLDQLDCVLHQKYLRERRYLVRSFYCQPAYFGTAALCSG